MIDVDGFREILALYRKHGWEIARILLAGEPSPELLELIGDIPKRNWESNAAWFTRSSNPGKMTWELRHLGDSPIALVCVLEDDADLESELRAQEARLLEIIAKKK